MVGSSSTAVCGVRDNARALAAALVDHGVSVTTSWCEQEPSWGAWRTYRQLRRWSAGVDRTVADERPDWVLWQYSGFTYAHRGIPVFVYPVVRRLRRSGVPIAILGHELTYRREGRGWRGVVVALTQRAVVLPLLRLCDGMIVTTDEMAAWLRSRPWLPTRPIGFLPVLSGLPPLPPGDATVTDGHREGTTIGVFGYRAPSFLPEPAVGAVGRLRRRGHEISLVLVGAPGPASPQGQAWRDAAEACGCGDAVRFTGVLDEAELARRLAEVDVVLFPDWPGPMSRRSALAAALALGKPVVAIDGPYRWERLVSAGAVGMAAPNAKGVADALEPLLGDAELRARQGERGLAFYRREMAPEVAAARLVELLGSLDGDAWTTPP